MENAEVFGYSTAPLTWHDFLERMRHPSAADFVKSIKRAWFLQQLALFKIVVLAAQGYRDYGLLWYRNGFIVSFSNNPPDPERDSAAVQEFLAKMEGAFRAHSLWAGCSEEELESAGEGLEKYVMTKLFTRAFASLPEDVKHDEELFEKISLVQQFIQPENLDIKPSFQNETSWLLAQKELQKINMYKAPRDKLACILNCCKVINNLLLNASIASNDNPPGADEFLPVLIYVTIKANPPQLHSNLLYIQRYRCQSRLVSEAAYFFTNMLSAESFIWNIDAKSLSMDEIEFEKNMECAQALLSGLFSESSPNQSIQDVGHLSTQQTKEPKLQPPKARERNLPSLESTKKAEIKGADENARVIAKKPSVSELEKKGAADILKEDDPRSSFQEFPYLYANFGDLTLNDVEALLNGYKQLVLKYVCLSKGLGINSPSLPMPIVETQNRTGNVSKDRTKMETGIKEDEEVRRRDGISDGGPFIDVDSSKSEPPEDEPPTNSEAQDGFPIS